MEKFEVVLLNRLVSVFGKVCLRLVGFYRFVRLVEMRGRLVGLRLLWDGVGMSGEEWGSGGVVLVVGRVGGVRRVCCNSRDDL